MIIRRIVALARIVIRGDDHEVKTEVLDIVKEEGLRAGIGIHCINCIVSYNYQHEFAGIEGHHTKLLAIKKIVNLRLRN